jgi:uncharacterized protein (TIGR02328 family)
MYSNPVFVSQYYHSVFAYDISKIIYPEHNKEYLQECIENLKSKGIEI